MTIAIRPSHPYNAGTGHVRFSPTMQTLLYQAGRAVRCSASRMKGDQEPLVRRASASLARTLVHMGDSFGLVYQFSGLATSRDNNRDTM